MSDFILIQTVWHSDGITEIILWKKKKMIQKKSADN